MGKITLDGRGNFREQAVGASSGTPYRFPITGSYLIADDCTRGFTTIYPGLTAHFSLVLVDDIDGRKHAELVGTDTGSVATGTVKPIVAPAQDNQ